MNTKLIVGASALMLALSATPALGYSGSRDVVLPGGWSDAFTGGFSLAFCERLSDDATLSGVSPIYCERSGFGAFFDDIGCSTDFYPPASPAVFFGNGVADNAAGCLDDLSGSPATDFGSDTDGKDDFATGSVTVSATATVAGNEASWLVGNDRDDDGSVTTSDTDGSNDATSEDGSLTNCNSDPANVAAGCFDDEFIFGTDDVSVGFNTGSFCFTHDRDHAGGDWDSIVVFYSANLPPTNVGTDSPFVGTAKTDLSASSSNTACTRSGHGDSVAAFGGASAIPAAPRPEVVVIANVASTVVVQLDGTDLDCKIDTDLTSGGNEIPLVSVSPVDLDDGGNSVTCSTNGANCTTVGAIIVGVVGGSATSACGALAVTVNGPVDANAATGSSTANWTCTLNPGAATVSVAICAAQL